MEMHRTVNTAAKGELIVDIIELVSGISLALFLWAHMVFVSTVLLGVNVFNGLAEIMEVYNLEMAAVAFIVLAFTAHVGAILRRVPGRWRDQKIVWEHAKLIKHTDTWTWLFQIVSGAAILVLVTIHVFVVVNQGINADLSAARMNSPFLWFYLVLLFLGEYHASIGLYRAAIKWGWVKRTTVKRFTSVLTFVMLALGVASIWMLYVLGGQA